MTLPAPDENRTFVVYGLCLVDDDSIRYIGKTSKTAAERLYFHRRSASRSEVRYPVHKWMRAKGPENVITVVLGAVDDGDDDGLNELEIALIAEHRAAGARLLNLTNGGEGTRGIKVSDAKRELMSRRMSGAGNPMHGVHRFGEANPMYGRSGPDAPGYGRQGAMLGKTHTPEARAKMSARMAGERNPMYGRTGDRAPGFGKTGAQNPMYGKPGTMRGRTGAAHPTFGKPKTPEQLHNMREGMHRAHHIKKDRPKRECEFCMAVPELVAAIELREEAERAASAERKRAAAARRAGVKHSDETKAKMSAAQTARYAKQKTGQSPTTNTTDA
jgi:hypothetical protein